MQRLKEKRTKTSQRMEDYPGKLNMRSRIYNSLFLRFIVILGLIIIVIFITTIARGVIKNKDNNIDLPTSYSEEVKNEMNSSDSPSDTSLISTSPEASIDSTNSYLNLFPDMFVEKSDFIEHTEGDKVIYLTFDDGPCNSTSKLLDVLDELDVKATFFVTAQFESSEQLVYIIKEIYDRGHALGVHSYTHDYSTIYSTVTNFLTDYKMMDDLIVAATGERSKIFRFSGGSNTAKNQLIRDALIAEMERRGFIFHDWNAHNGDSEGYNREQQIERAVRESSRKEKSVILMHNMPNMDIVIDTLPDIVSQLRQQGYRFDVLDETVRPFQFS